MKWMTSFHLHKFTVNEVVTHIMLLVTYREDIREVYLTALRDKGLGKPATASAALPTQPTTTTTTDNNSSTDNQ